MKYLKCFVLLLMCLLLGCTASPPGPTAQTEASSRCILPEVREDYWNLFDNRFEVVFGPDSNFRDLCLTLLSAQPLTREDSIPAQELGMTVTAEGPWTILSWIEPVLQTSHLDLEPGECVLDEETFLLYQGVSGKEVRDFHKLQSPHLWPLVEAYRALEPEELPRVYCYKLVLCVYSGDPEAVLDHIDVTFRGETRRISLGRIQDRSSIPEQTASGTGLVPLEWPGTYRYPGREGRVRLLEGRFEAQEDVTVLGMEVDGAEVADIHVTQSFGDGAAVDTAWDGPISLAAGEVLTVTMTLRDPFFAGTLGGTCSRVLRLHYQAAGETYELRNTYLMASELHFPFSYLALDAGLDVEGCYLEDGT